jgi:hypothetical protein
MIHNDTHKALIEAVGITAWDEDSQILHLTSFIEQKGLTAEFTKFINEVAAEEEADAKRLYEEEDIEDEDDAG